MDTTNPNPAPAARQERLTANESALLLTVAALRDISANVWRTRIVGFFGGCAATYYGLKRADRLPPTAFRAGFITIFGGLVGSFALLPLGVAMSRQSLQQVEDPQHLARVIRQQLEQRRPGAPLVLPEARDLSIGTEGAMQPGTGADTAWSDVPAPQPEAAQPAPQSRWDELRRSRMGHPSAWEHIRQENARKSLGSAGAPEPSGTAPASAPASSDSAGFGLPSSAPPRERARRDYEAAFERERKGIDTPMDGDMAWRT